MTPEHVTSWVETHPLTPIQVDCATAVMLKILDGKCKMAAEEKNVMALLYDRVRDRPGELLGDDIHHAIETGRENLDDRQREIIYEQRVMAETRISRPVMKAFKAMIRGEGLLQGYG